MGWQSHSKVVRVSPDRLQKLITAARRTSFSHRLGAVWIEHILQGRRELDITDIMEQDSATFPPWFKEGCDMQPHLVIRSNRVLLVKERNDRDPSAPCSQAWESFKACSSNTREAEDAGLLISNPPFPSGLVQVLPASDILTLSGVCKQLHRLSHDLVDQEEQILEVRLPAWKGRMSVRYRIEERVRTLTRGSVYLEAVHYTYEDLGALREDLNNMTYNGESLVCNHTVHAAKLGVQPGWFCAFRHAWSPDEAIRGDVDTIASQADPLKALLDERFWQKDGMRVSLHFSAMKDEEDTKVEDMGDRRSTCDSISCMFPHSCIIQGGSQEDPMFFCNFYAMLPNRVKAFSASLMREPALSTQHAKILKNLQALVLRASHEGQGLFMEHTCC